MRLGRELSVASTRPRGKSDFSHRRLHAAISAALAGDPLLVAACGSSSTGPSTPPDMVGDISIVRGAEFLTTAAFEPNPKTVSLVDGGGAQAAT